MTLRKRIKAPRCLLLAVVGLVLLASPAKAVAEQGVQGSIYAKCAYILSSDFGEGPGSEQGTAGTIYLTGFWVEQDFALAMKYYREGANLGNAACITNLGLMYAIGAGTGKNFVQAYMLFNEAAKLGNTEALVNLGVMFDQGHSVARNLPLAIRYYRDAAEKGNSYAQSNLGVMYAEGHGVPQDYTEARKWFDTAAHKLSEYATFNLGILYARGYGVEQDRYEAFELFNDTAIERDADDDYDRGYRLMVDYPNGERTTEYVELFHSAADRGLTEAQLKLGVMYAEGKGVPQDMIQAYMWLDLAAIFEDDDVMDLRDAAASMMSSKEIEQAQQLSNEWLPKW